MDKYTDYIKFGDILISPSLHFEDDYILRCCECNEYYSNIEELLIHCTVQHSDELVQEEDMDTDFKIHGLEEGETILKVEIEEYFQTGEREMFFETQDYIGTDNDGYESSRKSICYSSLNKEHISDLEENDTEKSLEDGNTVEENSGQEDYNEKLLARNEWDMSLKSLTGPKRHTKTPVRKINELKCQYCSKAFKTVCTMKKHLKKHRDENGTGTRDYENESDQWSSLSTSRDRKPQGNVVNYSENKSIISQTKEYKNGDHKENSHLCNQCSSRFKTPRGLERHLRNHLRQSGGNNTESKSTSKPVCKLCNKQFAQTSCLKTHLRTHTGEKPYLCPECGKTFRSLSNMKQHLRRHGTERPYECPDCPTKFPCITDLVSHRAVHTKIRPHVCDICGSGFGKPYLLKVHKIYHGERKHKCDYCDMRFFVPEQYKRHMRTHTGEKPFQCKFCDKAFAQRNVLITHLRVHLGDKVYRCNLCPQGFRRQGDLRTHFNTHTNDDEETKERNLKALREEDLRMQMKFGTTTTIS
ncbi:zinc finger protein 774 isoform X1 [Stomoxys calcitrans]|nr:zinc finger protein 774 isoform X1 [Stomoxys calcitrans]